MNISQIGRKPGAGFALLAMLCSLIIILIVFASVMYWISTNSKQMKENQQYIASEAAAEGATEDIFAHMDRDYLYGNLDTSNDYALDLPTTTNIWPVTYSFDASVAIGLQSATNGLQYLGAIYTNLLGEPQTNTITVTATPWASVSMCRPP
jgi:type II secretory pathway pseudopilin PulG